MLWLPVKVIRVLLLLTATGIGYSQVDHYPENQSYVIIGVSGGLQDGFPDHIKVGGEAKNDVSVSRRC